MKNLLTLMKMELIFTKRTATVFIMGVGMPVAFFLFFSGMYNFDSEEIKIRAVRDMMISMTAFSSIGFALFTLPTSLHDDRESNWLNIINRSPISLWQYYLAKFLRVILNFAIAIVTVFVIAHFVRGVNMDSKNWIAAFFLIILGSVSFCSLGLFLGLIKNQQTFMAIVNFVYLGLSMLGGLWFPVYLFPTWMQNIAKVTPTYHLLTMVNSYLKDNSFATTSILVLTVYTVAFIVITLVIKKRMEIK